MDLSELKTLWDDNGVDADALQLGTDGTVAAGSDADRPGIRIPTAQLPALVGGPDQPAQLKLGDTLGQGGMGVVRRGRQIPLDREVAVKGLRADGSGAVEALLGEARVTGALEHPNIVPIYTLGRGGDQAPLIVMKRIEGTSWTETLTDSAFVPEDGVDVLTFHLEVLMSVCRAVHFAHSRGVVHRDIKPDNVMIGTFGEVYLLDWGIAVGLDDTKIAGLPGAASVKGISGTPDYMAPEMAAGDGSAIGVQTDVYLLGAVLHEILVGAPPHRATSLTGMLYAAYLSEPHAYPEHAPAELAALCHQAMHRKPARRPEGADVLRRELAAFLTHRGSNELTAKAELRLAAIGDRRSEDVLDGPEGRSRENELRRLFTECRFGFVQALDAWPENERAHAGLQQVLLQMIEHELEHGTAAAAGSLLEELAGVHPELEERVEAQRRDQAETRRELERLARLDHDADISFGALTRFRLMLVMAGLWLAVGGTGAILDQTGVVPIGNWAMTAFFAFCVAGTLVGTWTGRQTLWANEANRRFVLFGVLGFTLYGILFSIAEILSLPVEHAIVFFLLVATVLWGFMTVFYDRDMVWMIPITFFGMIATLLFPVAAHEGLAAGGFVGIVAVAFAWRRRRRTG